MNKKEEIFTIGDKTNNGTISKFEIDSNGVRVFFEEKPKNYHVSLNSIKHIKKPLFTTEDGVEIFEGDSFTLISLIDIEESTVDSEVIMKPYDIWEKCKFYELITGNSKNFLPFSTKKAAENYVKMNKPCLSLQEIKDVFEKDVLLTTPKLKVVRTLEKIVKQKLK